MLSVAVQCMCMYEQRGESALMKASAGGHVNITQLIIAHRAILDLKNKVYTRTCIHVHVRVYIMYMYTCTCCIYETKTLEYNTTQRTKYETTCNDVCG